MEILIPAALIALAFVTWTIVGKYSNIDGPWVGLLAALGTFTLIASISYRTLGELPPRKAIIVLLLAGAINGIGLYFYSMKISDKSIPTGIFISTTCAMMVLWGTFLDYKLNGSTYSSLQYFGFGSIAFGIYLVGR